MYIAIMEPLTEATNEATYAAVRERILGKLVYSDDKSLICPKCTRKFIRYRYLMAHLARLHGFKMCQTCQQLSDLGDQIQCCNKEGKQKK